METLRSIALASIDGDLPEVPVLYTGSFEHGGRKFDVTEADLDQAVENFNAQLAAGTEIPTDYEHGQKEDGKASGWFKALRREGSKLYAKIAWTDKAREQIAAGERKYFSPEFVPSGKDESGKPVGFKLLAGGLVTRPHLKGLGAVAMTDDAISSLAEDAIADVSAANLSSPFTFSSSSGTNYTVTLNAPVLPAPKDRADMSDQPITAKDLEAVTTKLSEAEAKIVALAERADAAETRADDAEKAHKETSTQLFEAQRDQAIAQAQREGRIDAKEATLAKWHERAEKFGIDELKSLLSDLPAETIPMTERGHGHDRTVAASDAPEDVDADRYAVDERAKALMSEGKTDDYLAAVHMAADELGVTL